MVETCVYIVESYGFYKIGKTASLQKRLRDMRIANPLEIILIHAIYTDQYSVVEKALHAIFTTQHVHGEWFKLTDEQISVIKSMPVDEILHQAGYHPEPLKVRWDYDPAEKITLRDDIPVPPDGINIIVPMTVLDEAQREIKPPKQVFVSLMRLMSLAWKSFYKETPALNEQALHVFLKLSRRQYQSHKAEMERRGWVISRRPSHGYIQFQFPHAIDINEVDDEYKPSQDVR